MAVTEPLLLAVEGTRQALQLSSLAGKSYVVGNVSTAANGALGNWLILQPLGASGSQMAQKTVAIKLEGARQAAELAGMAGKTVTVAKTPVTVGGACNWLALQSGTGGSGAAATAGGMAKGKAASSLVMVKLEGARQAAQLSSLSGKTFTVVQPPMMAGKGAGLMFLKPAGAGEQLLTLKVKATGGSAASSSLIGKSFTLGKAPTLAAAKGGSWMVFKPVAASTAVKGGVAAAFAKGAANKMGFTQTVALNKTTTVASSVTGTGKLAGTSALGGTAAKAASGGVIWKGTGLGLGLGLGLGGWGPLLLVGAAATGVGVYSYIKKSNQGSEDEVTELVS